MGDTALSDRHSRQYLLFHFLPLRFPAPEILRWWGQYKFTDRQGDLYLKSYFHTVHSFAFLIHSDFFSDLLLLSVNLPLLKSLPPKLHSAKFYFLLQFRWIYLKDLYLCKKAKKMLKLCRCSRSLVPFSSDFLIPILFKSLKVSKTYFRSMTWQIIVQTQSLTVTSQSILE